MLLPKQRTSSLIKFHTSKECETTKCVVRGMVPGSIPTSAIVWSSRQQQPLYCYIRLLALPTRSVSCKVTRMCTVKVVSMSDGWRAYLISDSKLKPARPNYLQKAKVKDTGDVRCKVLHTYINKSMPPVINAVSRRAVGTYLHEIKICADSGRAFIILISMCKQVGHIRYVQVNQCQPALKRHAVQAPCKAEVYSWTVNPVRLLMCFTVKHWCAVLHCAV